MTNNFTLLSDAVGVDLAAAIANLEQLKISLEAEIAKLAADREQLEVQKGQLTAAQAQLTAAQLQLEDATFQLEKAQTQLNDARAQLEAALADLANDTTRLNAAKASLDAAKLKFEAATKQLNAAKTRFEAAKIQLDAATASLNAEKSGLEDDKAELQIKVSQLETNIYVLQATLSQLENDKQKLEAEQRQSDAEIQGLNDKVRELETRPKGQTSHMIPARKLSIVWGDTPQYWTWKALPESMSCSFLSPLLASSEYFDFFFFFASDLVYNMYHCRYAVAELVTVCWLEFVGSLDTSLLVPNTNYGAYLVFKLADGHSGIDSPPAETFVGIAGGEKSSRNVTVVNEGEGPHPRRRQDGWMEAEMGEYYVRGNDGELEIRYTQYSAPHWKSGLVVQGIEVRAK